MSIDKSCDDVLRYLKSLESHESVDKEEVLNNVNISNKELDDVISILSTRGYINTRKRYFDISKEGIDFITFNSFEKIVKHSNTEVEKLQLEIDHLTETLIDYNKVKSRAKRSEWYAILAIIVSLLAVVLPMLCNKSN